MDCHNSFCFGSFKGLESSISNRIRSFQECFPSCCASTSFSFRPFHVFHSTTRRTPRLAYLHLPVRTSSSVPSCSVWDGALAELQASCPFQTYENAARCHVRITWTRLHISKRVAPLAPSLDCRLASVKLAPYISLALRLALDFTVFILYVVLLFLILNSEVMRKNTLMMCEDIKLLFSPPQREATFDRIHECELLF